MYTYTYTHNGAQVLSHPEARELHGYDSMVVLTLLINYRKYEVSTKTNTHTYACVHVHTYSMKVQLFNSAPFQAANPYVIKLSVLDDEIALNVSINTCVYILTCMYVCVHCRGWGVLLPPC